MISMMMMDHGSRLVHDGSWLMDQGSGSRVMMVPHADDDAFWRRCRIRMSMRKTMTMMISQVVEMMLMAMMMLTLVLVLVVDGRGGRSSGR